MNTSSGDSIMSVIPEKNPLLISTVIKCILEHLPVEDMKNCRLICRPWNTETEPLLRKRAKIIFTPGFRTSAFLEYYSDSRLSALPFTAFKFTNFYLSRNVGFLSTELDYFFRKCGKSIKSLELNFVDIWVDDNPRGRIKELNISHWIELLSDKMDKLTIDGCHSSTRFALDLENLAGIKSLSLTECDVIVNSSNINRIAPSEISLMSVTFLNQNGKKLNNVIVNEFVDFSKCWNIKLYKLYSNTAIKFDMSTDIVNAKKVEFARIQVLNSGFSKIKTDFLSVSTAPSEAIKMQMKELDIGICSSINLTYLPQTIEKLKITRSFCVPDINMPLDLPNLKYLHLDQPTWGGEGTLRVFQVISWFKNCSNLVDVHLEGLGWKCELGLAWLPRNVKRLKLTKLDDIVFLGNHHPINVDVLLLDASINSKSVEMLMQKIIPKVLVRIVTFDMDCGWRGKENAEEFLSFVRKNTQLEKIVINTLHGLASAGSSGRNSFLQFVGEDSLCYEFSNQIAKAISKEEFEKYYDINCIKC